MLDVRCWILDKEIPNYSIMLLTPLDLAAEMILDTGFWILDKNLHKSRISHLVSSIEHPASSIQYPVSRSFAILYPFTITFLVFLILSFFTGCALLPGLKKDRVPKEITYTVPKWKKIGQISNETPTVTRILNRYLGNMSAAVSIIKSNYYKYDEIFYKALPFGASMYISENGELLINKDGGNAPETLIIKRKPNPKYYAIKKKSSIITRTEDDASISSIIEEDLKE
jgi:hypothetical protein